MIADPDFAKLSASDQQSVLSEFDPDFGKISADEFLYVLTAIQKGTAEREHTRTLEIPDSAKQWLRPEKKVEAERIQSFPETMSDAEIMKAFQTDHLLPRPKFCLATALRAHPWNVFGGLALFISGLSVLGWSFRGSSRARDRES